MEELDKSIQAEAERVFRHLAVDYLTKNDPSLDNPDIDPLSLVFGLTVDGQDPSYLQPILSPDTGEIVGYEERPNDGTKDDSARCSMSIRRAPDAKSFNKLLGSSTNVPFLPAGFHDEVEKLLRFSDWKETKEEHEEKYLDFKEPLATPPGFTGPVQLSSTASNTSTSKKFNLDKAVKSKMPEPRMPTVDLSTADIFDIMDFVSVEATPLPKIATPAAIVRPVKKESQAVVGPPAEQAQSDELEDIDSAINAPIPVQAPKDVDGKKMRSKDSVFDFASLMDVTKKVEKFDQLRPVMAKKYPFELDPFQQQAVVCMEDGTSVFVAAHTSAGKTVVAEYAIALCSVHRTRVIYTSPIKALSNQKFRDFKMTFDDVGLVTGDIQLNSEAFCLIMTTEILRSMLYNGSEVIRELEWVIFDEVHYINDADRGHVWEEVLIMLPAHVKIVMLSATVPNCVEFADWVGRIKNRKIAVIQTLKRPVPLEHYLYTGQDGKTKKDLFVVMDKSGEFLSWGYKKAVEAKNNTKASAKGSGYQNNRYNPRSDRNVYINLIDFMRSKELLPMVIFVFSRKRCDENAQLLQSVDLTTAKEKSEVHKFFSRCVDRLKGSDKLLPQVLQMEELCKRGFAVHHSGILPILKEVVELLFQQGYVKILFATETFAMGVNMPARTVAFDSIEKFDGNQKRILNPTEYVQMAGRAGRRGLDSTGTVIILCKGPSPPEVLPLTSVLLGKAVKLESRFRITYGMLLNLLRVEQLRIEDMLQRSYVERSSLRLVVSRKEQITEIDNEIVSLPSLNCSTCFPSDTEKYKSIIAYHHALRAYLIEMASLWPQLVSKHGVDKLFTLGRVLLITYPPLGEVGRLAAVLKTKQNEAGHYTLTLLLTSNSKERVDEEARMKRYASLTEEEQRWMSESLVLEHAAVNGLEAVAAPSTASNSYRVLEDIPLKYLLAICKQQLKSVDTNAILEDNRRRVSTFRDFSPDRSVAKLIVELDSLAQKWSGNAQDAAWIYVLGQDIQKTEMGIYERIKWAKEARQDLLDDQVYACRHCLNFVDHLKLVRRRIRLEETRDILSYQTSSEGLLLADEYCNRLEVLRSLSYIDKNNMVELKGKVACEINHMELLITELILENKFENRSYAEIAALLSPLTCQYSRGKDESMEEKPVKVSASTINELKRDLVEVALRIDAVQQNCRVTGTSIMDELKFGLMEAVHEWANGVPFAEIMQLTEAQEGLIVRCIQRLDEVCKDVRNAARIIGDPELFEKMEETSASIRRDIVFAASLYTTE